MCRSLERRIERVNRPDNSHADKKRMACRVVVCEVVASGSDRFSSIRKRLRLKPLL
jgi:hypothetical protein